MGMSAADGWDEGDGAERVWSSLPRASRPNLLHPAPRFSERRHVAQQVAYFFINLI